MQQTTRPKPIDRAAIRKAFYEECKPYAAIAKIFKVSPAVVAEICSNRTIKMEDL